MSLLSPLRRVSGLGSAKEGAGQWWAQRVTSIALVILALWFVASLLSLADLSHAAVLAWIGKPFNAVLLILLTGTVVYHSQLGAQVVIEDYVSHEGLKIATMLLINFLHVAMAALGVFAVLLIALGSAT